MISKILYLFCFLLGFITYLKCENSYKLIIEGGEFSYVNTSIVEGTAFFYSYNRTTKALNASFKVIIDVPEDALGIVDVYQFRSNEYRKYPVAFKIPLEEILEYTYFDLKRLCNEELKPKLKWPVKKGATYSLSNFVVNEDTYPPNVPSGRYKIVIKITTADRRYLALTFLYYIEIREKIKIG